MKKISPQIAFGVVLASATLFAMPVVAETMITAIPTTQITVQPGQFTFTKDLSLGVSNEGVRKLQAILNTNLKTQVANLPSAGSPGHEGTYFGLATKKAVMEFQKLYSITPTGYVGPQTRMILNHLIAGGGPVSLPTIMHFSTTKDAKGASVLTATYTGGGEAPSIWFAFGSSPSTITVQSKVETGSALGGTNSITLSGAGDPCYAQAFVKNSAGTTASEILNCASH
jgi:hypothetical protein